MKILSLTVLFFISLAGYSQPDPARITIARDSFGVPHIFAPTDAEVAYGLAWAHAEDDFTDIQFLMLSGKGCLGSALGKKGAEADYVFQLLRCRKIVEDQWQQFSPDFLAVVSGYIAGIKAYAKAHPHQIKYKKIFPFDEKDYLAAVVFSLSIFSGMDEVLPKVLGGNMATIPGFLPKGSNSFAVHPSRSVTREAMLVVNAHQPLEGPTAFYEAHVNSEEGWNMLGGVFPGGCLIFHGTNENLGWAHTVNYMDKIDVFQLEMNPSNDNQYRFDGNWEELEQEKARLKVKGIPIRIGKKIWWSKYGATVKTAKGVFAIRLPANMDALALEEWYRMNKARNFSEFYKAVSMTHLPMFNIMYADRYDTIFYISNGKIPVRNPDPQYNWRSTLPGNTSATLWTNFKPASALPQYINPPCGLLFNTNHAPFFASDPACNLDPKAFDPNDGFETYHNNRSQRVTELIKGLGKIDYKTLKRIKFDQQLPADLKYPYEIDSLWLLNATDYPQTGTVITKLQQWDRKAVTSSVGAAHFLVLYYYVAEKIGGQPARKLTKTELITACQYVHDYLQTNFGSDIVSLGEVQKRVRGTTEHASWGLPDLLTATYSVPYKNGMRKVVSGDAYICLVRYRKQGLPVIETINTFGASMHPDSPYFNDQQELFHAQQLKPMTLDKQEVLDKAVRIYHPVK